MKKLLINYIQNPKNDEYYTPEYAVKPLLEFIPKDFIIWESTDYGESKISKVFKENGYKVLTSHINEKQNFFNYEPKENWDICITNPPYSIKDDFLERMYSFNKPFCFLLPIESLGGQKRFSMYEKNGLDILVLDKRVEFVKNGAVWFPTAWFCSEGILPKNLVFRKIDKK